MPDHTAFDADEANVSKTSNMMAIPDEHNLHPTDRDWDTAKVYEHLESAVAGSGDRLVMGPTSEDVLFLTDFLARVRPMPLSVFLDLRVSDFRSNSIK